MNGMNETRRNHVLISRASSQVCHEHGVMHRDLKPENFLFANMKETAPLKAIDFGLSVFFKPGKKTDKLHFFPYAFLSFLINLFKIL